MFFSPPQFWITDTPLKKKDITKKQKRKAIVKVKTTVMRLKPIFKKSIIHPV